MELTNEIKRGIENYIDVISETHKKHTELNFPNLKPPVFETSIGKKYVKVICVDGQKFVHCFIDEKGNLYKSDTWTRPAKGIRGNIFNKEFPQMLRDFYKDKRS